MCVNEDGRGERGEVKDLLGYLDAFPPIPHPVCYRVGHDLPALVTAHAGL